MFDRKIMITIVLLSLLAVVCLNILASFWVFNSGMSQLHAENNLLENIQVALLALTTVAFLTGNVECLSIPEKNPQYPNPE